MIHCGYDHQAIRARKARWGQRWGRLVAVVGVGIVLILVAAAVYAGAHHNHLAQTSLGLALVVTMVLVWDHWDLQVLGPAVGQLNTESIRLECVVERCLLARIQPDTTTQRLWLAAAAQWEGRFVLSRLAIPPQVVSDVLANQVSGPDVVWDQAVRLSRQLHLSEIDSGVVIAATLLGCGQLQPLLQHLRLKPQDIGSVLAWQQRVKSVLREAGRPSYFGGIGRDWANGYTPKLDRFATNISKQIEAGTYRRPPSVHGGAINQLIAQLSDNIPSALVGGVGSGRTAIVYSLAERLLRGEQVGQLKYYQVMALNASVVLAAGGGIEELILELLAEAVHARNIILFLDEAPLFFASGPGSVDLSQILLPILQQNAIKLVCTMTEHDWQHLAAQQPALTGLIRRIMVPEPPPAETIMVVQDAALGIEHRSQALVLQEAVDEAVRLAGRYLTELSFPGKAITVLDSAAHYPEGGVISARSVQQAVQATTGAKVVVASQPERQQLLNLEDQIHARMVNQTRAVKVVADALRRARAGVGSPRRPVGSFLFLGPTGVGKTELAKALAASYYGGESMMLRLDMSEYQQPSDLGRLLAPASDRQTGVTLASGVRQRPSTVVLLDEVEKAHPYILDLLLQILDEGRLTDSDGREVSFKDAIVIATSNAAADEIRSRITAGQTLEQFESQVVEQLIASHAFRPELLNRFDEIVLFRPLTKPELRQVVNLMMGEVNANLQSQQVKVGLTAAAADWLVEHGYDPTLGARPLRRMVQRTVETVIADRLLAGVVTAGQSVTLDVADLAARPHAAKS